MEKQKKEVKEKKAREVQLQKEQDALTKKIHDMENAIINEILEEDNLSYDALEGDIQLNVLTLEDVSGKSVQELMKKGGLVTGVLKEAIKKRYYDRFINEELLQLREKLEVISKQKDSIYFGRTKPIFD